MAALIKFVMLFQLVLGTFSYSTDEPVEILNAGEISTDYVKRMRVLGLPCVNDLSFETYKQKMILYYNNKTCLNETAYSIFMDSVPRIYENHNSHNKRVKLNNTMLQIDVAYYDEYDFEYLTKHNYPKLYESYNEYLERQQHKGEKAFTQPIVIGLKNFCPSFGESYAEYEKRLKKLGLRAFSQEDFVTFTALFPQPGEFLRDYKSRCRSDRLENEETYNWVEMNDEEYEGLNRLIPQSEDTYETFKKRVVDLDITPIPEDVFDKIYRDKFFLQMMIKKYYSSVVGLIHTIF